MKRWELEAERMRQKYQRATPQRPRQLTPASKARYARKAYRLYMRLYEQTYWSLSEQPEGRDHRSRKILQSRRLIRQQCESQALELLQGVETQKAARGVIAGLRARVREHEEGLASAAADEFKRRAIEAAGGIEEYEKEQEILRLKAEVRAAQRGPEIVRRPRRTVEDMEIEIKRLKREVRLGYH